jgi:hypothetical protein
MTTSDRPKSLAEMGENELRALLDAPTDPTLRTLASALDLFQVQALIHIVASLEERPATEVALDLVSLRWPWWMESGMLRVGGLPVPRRGNDGWAHDGWAHYARRRRRGPGLWKRTGWKSDVPPMVLARADALAQDRDAGGRPRT